MRISSWGLAPAALALALALALAACGGAGDTADAEAADPVILQASMENVIKPQSQVVVSILIAALDNQPVRDVDPAKLTDAEWEVMETAATALRDEFVVLRDNPIQVVANPDDKLFEQDMPGMAAPEEVQARIDADPQGFAEHADELRAQTEQWLTAIEARDAAAMWRVALNLDPSCTQCHELFWSGEPEEPYDYGALVDDHDHDDHDDHDD